MADMQLVAKDRARSRKPSIRFNNNLRGAIPPMVVRIRIEKRNGTVGRQGKAALKKPGRSCDGAQDGGLAGCVWPIIPMINGSRRPGTAFESRKQPKSGAFAGTRKFISYLSATEKKFSMTMLCIISASLLVFCRKSILLSVFMIIQAYFHIFMQYPLNK